MGCANTRDEAKSEEERLITAHETDLCFNKHPASYIEAQIKRETSTGDLTMLKLTRLFEGLNIQVPLDRPDSNVFKFFEKLKVGDSISTNKLVLISILLGEGSYTVRAKLLFEHADVDARRRLPRSAVTSLFEEIAGVCVDCLPVLAFDTAHRELLAKYQQKLRVSIEAYAKAGVETMMHDEDSVTQAHFVDSLSKSTLKVWLVPLELRKSLVASHDDVMASMKRAYSKPADGKSIFFKRFPTKATEAQSKTNADGSLEVKSVPNSSSAVESKPSSQSTTEAPTKTT